MRNEELYNRFGRERITYRQIDELIGLAKGLCADGVLNQAEIEFLQNWLAANADITGSVIIAELYSRVGEVLSDGVVDAAECHDLLHTLQDFSGNDIGLGEASKSSRLPLCEPAPALTFSGQSYCFTGTFSYGRRPKCEQAVIERGGDCGGLSRKTNVLVIGIYATESWKHSAFGHKIMKAAEMRDVGVPITIVSEEHWVRHL